MNTSEIRLQFLEKIMHLSDKKLLEYIRLFEQQENAESFNDSVLTQEQHDELIRRIEKRKNGEGEGFTLDEFNKELQSRI